MTENGFTCILYHSCDEGYVVMAGECFLDCPSGTELVVNADGAQDCVPIPGGFCPTGLW